MDFNVESRALFLAYWKRGYPRDILEKHLMKASMFTQDQLLATIPKEKNTRQVLVTTFNPANPNLMGIVRKYWPILQTSRTLSRLFPQEPMCAFRRPKNLKDILVSARVGSDSTDSLTPQLSTPKNTACGTWRCNYCIQLDKSNQALSSFLGINIKTKILCRTSCHTTNVIYLITCLKCRTQYVGETKRKIRQRMYEHIRSIQKFGPAIQSTPVSEHFNLCCKKPARLNFQILETIKGNVALDLTTKFRRKRETWWILNLRTLEPMGMNVHV
jgi:hypothetical protein